MSNYEYHLGQILAAGDGALLTPLKTVAKILGLATRTLYNQVHKKTFPLTVVKLGKRSFVRASDLASLISGGTPPVEVSAIQAMHSADLVSSRRPGRPRKNVTTQGQGASYAR